MTETISFQDFLKVDIRVGKIIEVKDFPEAKKPAYQLTIDFGKEIGVKKSSAQITNYSKEELQGREIVAVVNFPLKQIGKFLSEVLVLGAINKEGKVILLKPDKGSELGNRIA